MCVQSRRQLLDELASVKSIALEQANVIALEMCAAVKFHARVCFTVLPPSPHLLLSVCVCLHVCLFIVHSLPHPPRLPPQLAIDDSGLEQSHISVDDLFSMNTARIIVSCLCTNDQVSKSASETLFPLPPDRCLSIYPRFSLSPLYDVPPLALLFFAAPRKRTDCKCDTTPMQRSCGE